LLERGEGWILNVSSQTATMPQCPPFPPTLPAKVGTIYGGTKAPTGVDRVTNRNPTREQ
jgi:hypothetical protein